jgi:hypothetical protein
MPPFGCGSTGLRTGQSATEADAVAAAQSGDAERVLVAAYLLAPGHFHDKLARAGPTLSPLPHCPTNGLPPSCSTATTPR